MGRKPTICGIRRRDTMKKARAWLDTHGIVHEFHDYEVKGIGRDRLAARIGQVGLEPLLDRAGTTFRKLPEAEKQNLDIEQAIALMLARPFMIERPVLDVDGELLVEFDPAAYEAVLGA